MQIPMLSAKTSKFEKGIIIRKAIFAGLSLAAIICGTLGSLYFQLLLNKGFDTLVAWGGVLLVAIFTLVSKLLSRKDDYKRFLSIIFTATNPEEAKSIKSLKQLVIKCEDATKDTIKGYNGYKQILAQNKLFIRYMTTNCTAFEKYAGNGLKTAICGTLLNFVLAPFKFFALVDYMLSGDGDINKTCIMSTTKFYQKWQRYCKGISGLILGIIVPVLGWVILSAIAASIVDSMLCVNSGITALIWFGLLGIIIQLLKFSGSRGVLIKIASDFTEENQVAQADFNICKAFASISPEYMQLCVNCGFMQGQVQVAAPDPSIQQDQTAQPEALEVAPTEEDDDIDPFAASEPEPEAVAENQQQS